MPRLAAPTQVKPQADATPVRRPVDPHVVVLPREANPRSPAVTDRAEAANPPAAPVRPPLPTVSGPSRGETPGSELDRADNGPAPTMASLPVVIYPTNPNDPTLTSGAGFFISRDGSAMTVAHVVRDCKSIQVASRYLKATRASLRAIDMRNDVAVIRMNDGVPPAVIGLADRPAGARALDIRGYPGDGDQLIATATAGTLLTERPPVENADRRDLLWIDAKTVRPGFSGGPVLTDNGEALGLVNGVLMMRIKRNGVPSRELKYVYGASTRMITAFLTAAVPSLVPDGREYLGADDVDKAVVHVICSH
jgi:S1-C subfamily serine protease